MFLFNFFYRILFFLKQALAYRESNNPIVMHLSVIIQGGDPGEPRAFAQLPPIQKQDFFNDKPLMSPPRGEIFFLPKQNVHYFKRCLFDITNIGNHMISSAIWNKYARVNFSN